MILLMKKIILHGKLKVLFSSDNIINETTKNFLHGWNEISEYNGMYRYIFVESWHIRKKRREEKERINNNE